MHDPFYDHVEYLLKRAINLQDRKVIDLCTRVLARQGTDAEGTDVDENECLSLLHKDYGIPK